MLFPALQPIDEDCAAYIDIHFTPTQPIFASTPKVNVR